MSSPLPPPPHHQNGVASPFPHTWRHEESTHTLILTVLKRVDPFVEEILITSAYVTVYQFDLNIHQWSRKNIEGSFFVVKRNTQPRFQFIVMNRRSTDNLVEDLLGDFEFDIHFPYLLYRNAAQEVNAIWFYTEDDCKAVANLFSRILNAYSKVTPKPKVLSIKSEFEELEAAQNVDVMEGPMEPLASSTATNPDAPDDSFVNFFTATKITGNTPNAAVTGQPLQSSSAAISSYSNNFIPTPLPTQQQAPSLQIPSTPSMSLLGGIESSSGHAANLVKPSFFSPPGVVMPRVPTSIPTAPPLHPVTMQRPSVTMQRPYGTPVLQPFPPPTPSPYLASAANNATAITRDKVRDAMSRLVQSDQFIEMVYQEMLNEQ